MILFADSSALVKLYLVEAGSDEMLELLDSHRLAVSYLAVAEVYATFSRRRREELLKPDEVADLSREFELDFRRALRIKLQPPVLDLVPGLCDAHPLRGADAVHLASALTLESSGLDTLFAASDQRLLAAAAAEGLQVVDPSAAD